jgi:transposase
MEAYSIDLRERIAAACDEGTETRAEIAERFGVSTSFIRKLLQRRRTRGTIAPKPRAGGGRPSLDERDLQRVRQLVEQKPDATLTELCQRLRDGGGSHVRIWTMCRALQALALPRKKSRCTPASATRCGLRRCVRPGWRRSSGSRRRSWFSWTRAARPRT